MTTILIAADICPIEGNRPYFERGDARSLLNDLWDEFQAADLAIANLECPLIERPTPIVKTGPVFGESSACINGIREAKIGVLCLANNHINDHGAPGVLNTLEVCRKNGISTVGGGENLEAAGRILVRNIRNVRVGILAMAEHEFSIAREDAPGANPLDLIEFVRTVQKHRSSFDYLIVLVHGGDEFLVPSPRIKKTCRFLIEMGANAVIVQHPHCLGGYENYAGGHIVYGQGALLMDEAIYRSRSSFHDGYVVKLIIADDASSRMEIVPFRQSDPVPGARRLTGENERQFRDKLDKASKAIADDAYVLKNWLRFCEERKYAYISSALGHNRILRKLNKNGFLLKTIYRTRQLLGVRNIACCETHREAIETIFKHGLLNSFKW